MGGAGLGSVTTVQYTIAPKPGSVSAPVQVTYSIAALQTRGYVHAGILTVPVYGLYSGYQNQVSMVLTRKGAQPINLEVDITTQAYTDPTGIYDQPDIVVKRTAGSSLGFSFIYVKSNLGSPVILDTDGEIRWRVQDISNSGASALVGDTFTIGDATQPMVSQLGLDDSSTQVDLPTNNYVDFAHDITAGKTGLLTEPDEVISGVEALESNVVEMSEQSPTTVVSQWDLAAIIGNYMTSQGDNAAAFVRPGVDWFHLNSAIYDPSDDSVIVSSRENFVIKLDYSTGAIKWILGDPTKYWYTFPSLRAKALTLAPGGLYPVGQHALSITADGDLMLFNDGLGSSNQPSGEPAGVTRTYSAVSAYSINEQAMTAQNTWNYDAGQTIYSPICSSAYMDGTSLLVNYATANNKTQAILVGLDSNQNVVFEFAFPTAGCGTSWNARPIALDNLQVMN